MAERVLNITERETTAKNNLGMELFWEYTLNQECVIDPNGNVLDSNPSFVNFFSNVKEIKNIFNVLPSQLQKNESIIREYLENETGLRQESLKIDYPYLSEHKIKWQRWEIRPVISEPKKFFCITGSDITEINEFSRDNLTKLYKREKGAQIINSFNPEEPLLVGSFDLNFLKQVNDTLGHSAGDKYIQKFVHVLKNMFGRNFVFRWGGDEFLVIKPGKKTPEEIETIKNELKIISQRKDLSFGIGLVSTNEVYLTKQEVNGEKSGGIRNPLIRLAIEESDKKLYGSKSETKQIIKLDQVLLSLKK